MTSEQGYPFVITARAWNSSSLEVTFVITPTTGLLKRKYTIRNIYAHKCVSRFVAPYNPIDPL